MLNRQQLQGLRGSAWWLAVAIGIGMAFVVAYNPRGSSEPRSSVVSVGLMVGIAALALGGLLGLLFGIPRYLQGEQQKVDEVSKGGRANGRPPYRDNTNLEEISDWLTKILVGVGLIEISQIGDSAGRLIAYVGDGMGGGSSSRIVAGATLVYFSTVGFLGGYLLTRMALSPALARAARKMEEEYGQYGRMGLREWNLRQKAEASISGAVLPRLRHFENLAMGMIADALSETHILMPRATIGKETIDCVLKGIQSETDYLIEIKYFNDMAKSNLMSEAVQEMGRAVRAARRTEMESLGLLLIVLAEQFGEVADPSTRQTRMDQVVVQLEEISQGVSEDVRISVILEPDFEEMTPQNLISHLLVRPDVATSVARRAG